jgi:hypothetical protein
MEQGILFFHRAVADVNGKLYLVTAAKAVDTGKNVVVKLGGNGGDNQRNFWVIMGNCCRFLGKRLRIDKIAFPVDVENVSLFQQIVVGVAHGFPAGIERGRQCPFTGELVVRDVAVLRDQFHQVTFYFFINGGIHINTSNEMNVTQTSIKCNTKKYQGTSFSGKNVDYMMKMC